MRIEYKPKDFEKDFVDFHRQIFLSEEIAEIFKKCRIFILAVIFVVCVIAGIRGGKYCTSADKLWIYSAYFLLLGPFIYLIDRAAAKNRGIQLSRSQDFNETVSFTFNNDVMINEKGLCLTKVKFRKISRINITDKAITIFTKNGLGPFFIPRGAAEVSFYEFVSIFDGYDIKIESVDIPSNKDIIKVLTAILFVMAAAFVISYYVFH